MGSLQYTGPPNSKQTLEQLERIQWRVIKMIRGMENLAHEERLKELGLFGLEKRKLRGWGVGV